MPDATEVSVDYPYDTIFVVLPSPVVAAWAGTGQVTIEGSSNSGVEIRVEKDFQCLHKPEERDPHCYPYAYLTYGF